MRRALLTLPLAASLLAPGAALAAQPAEALIAAMDIDLSLVSNIQTPNSDPQMFGVLSGLGVFSVFEASSMALMSTGNVDNITANQDYDYPLVGSSDGDRATLEFDIEVPSTANSFTFNFNFLSREYPEWVGSDYNDTFEVYLDSAAFQGQIVFDAYGNLVSVNNALFTVTNPAQLAGTGFEADGATGWVTTIAPCQGGEIMHLEFTIYDVLDGIFDSAVLIDGLAFSVDFVPDPHTDPTPEDALDLAYLSPKEGPVAGGTSTVIHGAGFNSNITVYWDDVPLAGSDWQVGSGGETLTISAVPAAPGGSAISVDLRVEQTDDEVTLLSAYTYHEGAEGDVPPRITSVSPSEDNPAGGVELRLYGLGLQGGAAVFFDDVEAEVGATVQSDDLGSYLLVITPAGEPGWVEITLVNPSGLISEPGYPFEYSEAAPDQRGGVPAQAGCGSSLAPGGGSNALALVLFFGLVGLAGSRRRGLGR